MHVVLTELDTREGRESDLERELGPGGPRSQVLSAHPSYLGTELLRAVGGSGEYVMMDRWSSRAALRELESNHPSDLQAAAAIVTALADARPSSALISLGRPHSAG